MENQMVFKRYEMKYVLTRRQYEQMLLDIEPHTQSDEHGFSTVRNVYYDTPDFRLIRESLEKPIYKEKLRLRSYCRASDGEPVFAELKKKYRDVVYKRRIILPREQAESALAGERELPDSQIGREISYALDYYKDLAPAAFICYDRQAFYGVNGDGFRLTFDENIRYRTTELTLDSEPYGLEVLRPELVLMELKAAGGLPMWIVRALSRERIFKTSFSKYGTAYTKMLAARQKGVCIYA